MSYLHQILFTYVLDTLQSNPISNILTLKLKLATYDHFNADTVYRNRAKTF
jgi:hypothetical protein